MESIRRKAEVTFPIAVYIRDVDTGYAGIYLTESGPDWDGESPNTFIWSEGNFSCDCNRSIFLHSALGLDEPKNLECGERRYAIDAIVRTDTHEIVYRDSK